MEFERKCILNSLSCNLKHDFLFPKTLKKFLKFIDTLSTQPWVPFIIWMAYIIRDIVRVTRTHKTVTNYLNGPIWFLFRTPLWRTSPWSSSSSGIGQSFDPNLRKLERSSLLPDNNHNICQQRRHQFSHYHSLNEA